MEIEAIKTMIETGLAGAQVTVDGDGTHFQASIVTDQFTGKTPLARHRMVYQALGDRVGREIHALSIQAWTPEEWEQQQQAGMIK